MKIEKLPKEGFEVKIVLTEEEAKQVLKDLEEAHKIQGFFTATLELREKLTKILK